MLGAAGVDNVCSYEDYRLTPSAILQYIADPRKQLHKQYILQECGKDGFLLEQLPPGCRNSKGIVLAAVRASGSALQFASTVLKADKAVVLAAIRSDPFALEYASTSLKKDAKLVLQAVQRDASTLQLADPQLYGDAQFMLAAVAADATAATRAAPALLADAEWRAAALHANDAVAHYFVSSEFFPGLPGEGPAASSSSDSS